MYNEYKPIPFFLCFTTLTNVRFHMMWVQGESVHKTVMIFIAGIHLIRPIICFIIEQNNDEVLSTNALSEQPTGYTNRQTKYFRPIVVAWSVAEI